MAGKKIELSRKTEITVSLIFIVFFFLIGLATSYFFNIRYVFKNASIRRDWEKVPCNIVSLGIESKKSKHRARVSKGRHHRRRSSTSYFVQTEYNYEYQGKGYTNDTYNHQQGFSSKSSESMHKRINEIQKKDKPICYVNPQNPQEAFLDPRISKASNIPFSVGIGFMAMSGLMLLQMRRRLAKGR